MTPTIRGVHSIDHYALFVPSLDDARQFFASFGLEVGETPDALELRAADGHRWARMLPGPRKSLAYLSFNCFAEDYPALRQQAEAAGARFEAGDGEGFWFRDPDGNLLQVKVGAKHMPDHKQLAAPARPAVRGVGTRDAVAQVRPRRLSHVLLFSPDVPQAVTFYERALGLRLSDHSQDIIAFTHAPHGCDHHLVAFCKSGAKGFHHAAWEVDGVDDVGNGAEQMANAGYREGWGTGRHCLGSNYFHYVRDPWGSFCEYSADMDFIDAGSQWPAGDFPPENSLYLWGPSVPEYFVRNTEADSAPAKS
ncbi:Glyoxalase/Bleomycin resistance protein/Dioxygenase superfamily protein [Pseudomonas delhiensis]|uniref:Glyoxalase/Bleomycin resistance protein/Dioxygenase superfamily protein n=1 Tax=Pseudomonas delhiensis TaxID=366289 RepID=A0A239KD58_9PSED|nr:VOC family protein [Pseudomonas delhiensis]SDJ32527.1 Glyoxalase/Bleomycin resistance protein/Dioxygenase superfamily protein [Pseudomonas delhiensis]SNT15044.1 Glyoxalase/Bleomycin resistance protein/Dioxygenase superfamily protein [Pseudomonas delhiensis]